METKPIQAPLCSIPGCGEVVGWEIGAGESARLYCSTHGWEAMEALRKSRAPVTAERRREVAA